MARYFIDQKRLLGLHDSLDPIKYKVGLDGHGNALGKAAFGTDPGKIKGLDCSGYVRYVLHEASEGKITVPNGSWNQDEWCSKQGLSSLDYAKAAGKADNILRLGYFPKSGTMSYGHVWLVLNGKTLESHGSKGVNRRAWNTSVLLKNAKKCYEIASTTVLSPARYRVTSKLKDPELRKLLDQVIDNDKKIDHGELLTLIQAVVSDGKVTMQEVRDLKSILDYATSLSAASRSFLQSLLPQLQMIQKAQAQLAAKPATKPAAGGGSGTPTQKADAELYRRHPELKGRALTGSSADSGLRSEWKTLYRQFGGR